MLDFVNSLLGNSAPEDFVGIDIGASTIKIAVVNRTGEKPVLETVASIPTPAQSLLNNEVKNAQILATAISTALEVNDVKATRASFSLPGPAVFTKRIQLGAMSAADLEENIRFEAANYIPHDINAVHLDYQVLGKAEDGSLDVLIIAIKNEIINGFTEVIQIAGLEPAIADVDYFALENVFALSHPEPVEGVVVLLDIGARYTGVSIIQDKKLCFSGDVPVGGRLYTDALCETLGVEAAVAEKLKSGIAVEGVDENLLKDTLDRTTQSVASEIHRQLGFFWNAAELSEGIETLYISGGASKSPGLLEELKAKTGITCVTLDPFETLTWGENLDNEYLTEVAPSVGVSVALAMRRFSDKAEGSEK